MRLLQVHRDAINKTVFAIGMGDGQRDRLFRAPDEATRERWVRALVLSMSEVPVGMPHTLPNLIPITDSDMGVAGKTRS